MIEVFFTLDISPKAMMRYYRGEINMVTAMAEDGTRVRFHASNLRPFLSHSGVRGRFRLRFDGEHKLIDLKRVG